MSEPPDVPFPARPIGNIYCGTCGWTDRTLIESRAFYPAQARSPAARLRHYAQVFPIVEVDATYYALPSEENARLWAERTPPGFVLNIKAFGLLTYHPIDTRRLPIPVRERLPAALREKKRVKVGAMPSDIRELIWTMHIEALRPIAAAGKLGCMLFQFPPWFAKTRANVEYLRELRDRLPWPIAVEFRGGGWMESERQTRTLRLLEEIGLAYVSVDEPQGFASSTPPVVACTAPLAVVRLHGHNAETWEKPNITAAERFRYLYSEDELRGWVAPVRDLAQQAEQVHVLMNNCYRDYAVRNAREFAALLAANREGTMTLDSFRESLRHGTPPAGLSLALQALWHQAKGDWDRAHQLAQQNNDREAAWVHAHLHRAEGDAANAGYWYRRAAKPSSSAPLAEEWEEIAGALLAGNREA